MVASPLIAVGVLQTEAQRIVPRVMHASAIHLAVFDEDSRTSEPTARLIKNVAPSPPLPHPHTLNEQRLRSENAGRRYTSALRNARALLCSDAA